MKKILLLSLAVMFLCWCLVLAASDNGVPTKSANYSPTAKKVAQDTELKANTSSIATQSNASQTPGKVIKKVPVKVEKQAPAEIQREQPQKPSQTSIRDAVPQFKQVEPVQNELVQSEKKPIRASASTPGQSTKYHGPALMPHGYTPSMITDNIITEGFENGGSIPTGWTDCCDASHPWIFNGGTSGSPNPGGAYDGSYAACFNIYSYPAATVDTLISPSMDLSAHSGSYIVSMWVWDAIDPYDYLDYADVYLSENGVNTYLGTLPTNVGAWTQVGFQFSSTSTDAKIKFVGHSDYGYTCPYIDDFSVDDFVNMGRCCYGDPLSPTCVENTDIACAGLGGTWTYGETCANPCQALTLGDVCAVPFDIPSLPYTDSQNTADFNNDYNSHGNDVIYTFTLTEQSLVHLTLCNTAAPFDTWMGIWADGYCGTPTWISFNDDSPNCGAYPASALSDIPNLSLSPGTYYVDVEAYGSTDGTYTLDITAEPLVTPANDDCANAEAITGPYPVTVSGTNVGATADCPGLLDWNGVWYTIDLPYTNNNLTIDWCPTSSGEIQYVGIVWMPDCSCSSYEFFTYTWPTCGSGLVEPYFTATIPGPTTIYLPAWVSSDPLGGEAPMDFGFEVNVTEAPLPPPNDNCADVTPVQLNPGTPLQFTGTNQYATQDCPSGSYPEVWEAFHTDVCQDVTVDYCGTTPTYGNVYIVLADQCPCGPWVYYSSWDATTCGDGNVTINYHALPPGDYWIPIAWDPAYGADGPYVINVNGTECPPPPANDDCASATAVGEVDSLPFSTSSATFDGAGDCMTSPNVWYLYTSTVNGPIDISLCGSSFDTKLAVYDGPDCPPPPPEPVAYQAGEDILNAAPITDPLPVSYTGTTVGYLHDYTPTTCLTTTTAPDVVYSYTPSSNETVTVTLCGSGYDTGLIIYDDVMTEVGCNDDYCGLQSGIENVALTAGVTYYFVITGFSSYSGSYLFYLTGPSTVVMLGCNDNFCGLQSQVEITAEIGHQYLVEVGGYGTAYGDGILTIAPPPPPPTNDDCANATAIGDVTDLPWQTLSATFDGAGACMTAPNIWFLYTATCTGTATASLCGTDWDTKIAAYDNTCPEPPPPPPSPVPYQAGENIDSAVPITDPLPVAYTGTTVGYVTDYFPSCVYVTTAPDVVYSFTPASDQYSTITLCGSNYDTGLFIYDSSMNEVACNDDYCGLQSGVENVFFAGGATYYIVITGYSANSGDYTITLTAPASYTILGCNDDGCSDPDYALASNLHFPVVQGEQYLIEVGGFGANVGSGVLTTFCSPPPPNDNCVDVNPADHILSDGVPEVYTGSNLGATNDCDLLTWDQVWIPFHLDDCMDVTISACGSDPVMGTLGIWIFTDCPCGNYVTGGSYNWTECVDANWTLHQTSLAPGDYYYPLYSAGAQGNYTITITGTLCPPPPPNPCNEASYSNGNVYTLGYAYGAMCDHTIPLQGAVADDFILPGSDPVTIDTVVGYLVFYNGVADPSIITSVGVTFYADNGGVPGGRPIDGDVACAHQEDMVGGIIATEDVAGTSIQWDPIDWGYQAIIPISNVTLDPGVTYWIELYPQFDYPPQMGWIGTDSQTGGIAQQIFPYFSIPDWAPVNPPADVAFCLVGPSAGSPALSYSPSSFTMTIQTPNSDTADLFIGNTGGADLTYSLAVDHSGWMFTIPDNGTVPSGATDTVQFIADAGSLSPGNYTGTITINSNDPAQPSVGVPVNLTVTPGGGGQCTYTVGDANNSGTFNGLDVTYSVAYFKGGPQPPYSCECTPGNTWFVAGDVNQSCNFNGLDVTYMVSYFKGGPPPHPCADCPPSRMGILLAPKAPAADQPQVGSGQ